MIIIPVRRDRDWFRTNLPLMKSFFEDFTRLKRQLPPHPLTERLEREREDAVAKEPPAKKRVLHFEMSEDGELLETLASRATRECVIEDVE